MVKVISTSQVATGSVLYDRGRVVQVTAVRSARILHQGRAQDVAYIDGVDPRTGRIVKHTAGIKRKWLHLGRSF